MKRLLSLAAMLLLVATVSAQLPSVRLRSINGKTVDCARLDNGGRPIIVDFFATWCKPCNRELSAIAEVYDEWVDETGVKLVAISLDEAQNVQKVKPLVDQNGWPYEVLLDVNGDLKRALGIQMIPYTLILDGDGRIVYKHNGYTDGAEQELIDKVRQLVKP